MSCERRLPQVGAAIAAPSRKASAIEHRDRPDPGHIRQGDQPAVGIGSGQDASLNAAGDAGHGMRIFDQSDPGNGQSLGQFFVAWPDHGQGVRQYLDQVARRAQSDGLAVR